MEAQTTHSSGLHTGRTARSSFLIITILVGLLLRAYRRARNAALRTQALKRHPGILYSTLQAYMSTKDQQPPHCLSKVVLARTSSDYSLKGPVQPIPDAPRPPYSPWTDILGPRHLPNSLKANDTTTPVRSCSTGTAMARLLRNRPTSLRGGGERGAVSSGWRHPVGGGPTQIPVSPGLQYKFGLIRAVLHPPTQKLPFNFNLGRLSRTGAPNGQVNNFLVYNDPWGKPYAYFATHGAQNNYAINPSDCNSLVGSSFQPYQTAAGQYSSNATDIPDRVGGIADRSFGSGGSLDPQGGSVQGGDADNLTNFTSGYWQVASEGGTTYAQGATILRFVPASRSSSCWWCCSSSPSCSP